MHQGEIESYVFVEQTSAPYGVILIPESRMTELGIPEGCNISLHTGNTYTVRANKSSNKISIRQLPGAVKEGCNVKFTVITQYSRSISDSILEEIPDYGYTYHRNDITSSRFRQSNDRILVPSEQFDELHEIIMNRPVSVRLREALEYEPMFISKVSLATYLSMAKKERENDKQDERIVQYLLY